MSVLPKDLLHRIRERAAAHDRDNTFCTEDLRELQAAGYLKANVPEQLGGSGLGLFDLSRAQRTLAAHAPATALAVNMHLLWIAVARILADRGDDRLTWVFRDAAAGEIFAFGISEARNDSVLLDSFCTARPDGNDFLVTGKKIFTTLSPVWTRLGVHAKTEGTDPRIVVGFLRRDALPGGAARQRDAGGEGITYPDSWNPLGMRATQSWNTRMDGVRLRGGDTVATYEPYDASDPIILAVSLAFGVLTSSVYAGIADRALELATLAANEPLGEGIRLDDPYVASRLTDAVLGQRSALDTLKRLAADIDRQADRDDWSVAVAAMKNEVTDEARRTVETAFRTVGSRAYTADSELARLYRDVLAGLFHPRSATSLASQVRSQLTYDS